MQLCTVLALLVSYVYLNQAIYGADAEISYSKFHDAEVSYSKFHDAEGKFPVKATNPAECSCCQSSVQDPQMDQIGVPAQVG